MEISIRPIGLLDVGQINEIRRQKEIVWNTLALPTEYEETTIQFVQNLGENDYVVVAESDSSILGMAGLHVGTGKKRHKGMVGICIHKDYHNQGIGRLLLEYLLDLADNWLMLKRVELEVLEGNNRAIHLYESLGFVYEGTKKYATIQNGRYASEIIMGRYRMD